MSDSLPGSNANEQDPPPALKVDKLVCGYGRNTVVRGVSIEVAPHSVVALVGPNGAGKSTLISAVAGLIPVTSGEISMYGEVVSGMSAVERSRKFLCTIPEGRGIYKSLTVRENLILQSSGGTEPEALERVIETFPILGSRLQQQAGTLSGGEQQMLSLSAAYARNPRLVVIDEASLGLAPVIVDLVFAFIEQLRATGTAMLIVDQFVHRVLSIATNVYVLGRGAVEWEGTPSKFLEGDLFERYLGSTG